MNPLTTRVGKLPVLPKCSVCGNAHDEIYDTPLGPGLPWGYLCRPCVTNGGNLTEACVKLMGRRLLILEDKKAEPDKNEEERWASKISIDDIGNMVLDVSEVHAMDGCRVESNGTCIHGYRSPLLILGVVDE